MKDMFEKYAPFVIGILLVILLYRMYTYDSHVKWIDEQMWVVISQNREIIEKLNQPLILDN